MQKIIMNNELKEKKSKVIVIVGPTASGKSDLAISLAKKFNGEIISADSKAVYQGFLIGTAVACWDTPNKKRRGKHVVSILVEKKKYYLNPLICDGIFHWLVEFVRPQKRFNVALYQVLALAVIKDIVKRKKIPIIVGGTGLYIDSLTRGLVFSGQEPDWNFRKKLERKKLDILVHKLLQLDPDANKIVDITNKRRVIRALELIIKHKKSLDSLRQKKDLSYKFIKIGLKILPQELNRRIKLRISKQIKLGLVNEAKKIKRLKLLDKIVDFGIGYKDILAYLEGQKTLQEAKDSIYQDTRQFAKRQLTWFKRDKEIIWCRNQRIITKKVKNFYGTAAEDKI